MTEPEFQPNRQQETTNTKVLAEKKFYKMGEVVSFIQLEPHVLRFWESEFEVLKPRKNGSGHRIYTRGDIDLLLKIKKLVHEEGFTIAGARQKIAQWQGGELEQPVEPMIAKTQILEALGEIKGIVKNLLFLLDEP